MIGIISMLANLSCEMESMLTSCKHVGIYWQMLAMVAYAITLRNVLV